MEKFKLNFLLVLLNVSWIMGFPAQFSRQNVDSDKIIKFMQTFGYLERQSAATSGPEAEALYKDDAIIDAIRKVQMFGALEQTGVLDNQTLELLEKPRCGVADIVPREHRAKRYVVGAKNWGKRKITYFIANWSPKVPEDEVAAKMEIAFEAWSKYSNLQFKRIYDSSADIIIAFGSSYHGDRYPFDGPGNVLAHAFYPYEENSFGGDIHFDNDENWKEGAISLIEGVDFLSVAVHELGHSLGLAHSPVYSSIMFPYYKGVTPAQLDYDDILAMYHLYIQKSLEENSFEQSDKNKESEDDESQEEIEKSKSTEDKKSIDNDKQENSENEEETVTSPQVENEDASNNNKNSEEDENEDESSQENDNEDLNPPELCSGNFDSMSLINDKIFIFKETYVWKMDEKFRIDSGFPTLIRNVFPKLPERFTKIDAVYEQKDFQSSAPSVIMFSGNEYLKYDSRGPLFNGPYSITNFTRDSTIEGIDAAMIWGKNNRTYLFSGNRFWRFNENKRLDGQYPRLIDKWNGVPGNLDAATTLSNGLTYFFKGKYFWVFNNKLIRPHRGFPRKVSTLIPSCH